MLRSLYRFYLEGCAAYGDPVAARVEEWRDLLAMADEVGADREAVWQVILADALGPLDQPPTEAR